MVSEHPLATGTADVPALFRAGLQPKGGLLEQLLQASPDVQLHPDLEEVFVRLSGVEEEGAA